MDAEMVESKAQASPRARSSRRERVVTGAFGVLGAALGLFAILRGVSIGADLGATLPVVQRLTWGGGMLLLGLGLASESMGTEPSRGYRVMAVVLLAAGAFLMWICDQPGC